ncbi:Nif3-like dinuclear metal center hexameric protein [Conexibacter sp. CPCC 206217]|uniref:Nif3-like dinuclear metal center hexameric protein n=1 Tax=Conexibacter sp. CPCC 206217 TaxID=3064574 RepID=UPI002715F3E0|nr:Nif3-like dinuclear metal center hexameric protein [Conexibacter sp. CPCC 206217]MDO8209669.1 Nif3-like dinuclear metal center hexameric protein [Conexibacter sp. CPCC 206217]
MGARVEEIVAYVDELLEIDRFSDYGPNGLQVPNVGEAREVTTVVTGVSAQLALFERAVQERAQLVLAHHGILWDFEPRRIGAAHAKRLRTLLCNDIALAGYHLPLDAHPEIGNNALIAAGLGAARTEPAFTHSGTPIGVIAHFESDDDPAEGVPAPELFARIATLTDRDPLVFDGGPPNVKRLGIVSGSAANDLTSAIDQRLDAFMTGEPKEHVMAQARENQIHFIAAGHYATETFGIRRVGELVAEKFGVSHHFVDLPNPV